MSDDSLYQAGYKNEWKALRQEGDDFSWMRNENKGTTKKKKKSC